MPESKGTASNGSALGAGVDALKERIELIGETLHEMWSAIGRLRDRPLTWLAFVMSGFTSVIGVLAGWIGKGL